MEMIRTAARLVFGFALLASAMGCEIDLGSSGGDDEEIQAAEQPAPAAAPTTTTTTTTQAAVPPPSGGSGDQFDVSGATTLGPHSDVHPRDARITRTLSSANVEGGAVRMAYDSLGWPSGDSGIGSGIDGRVYIFWQDGGRTLGGHFDWKGVGQTVKTLGNVGAGYLDGQKPRPGSQVAFCIVKNDGTERTNVKVSNTPY